MALQEIQQDAWVEQYLAPYLTDRAVCSMDVYIQHGNTTTLAHCLSVVHVSFLLAARLHLKVNTQELALGALLHDFYLYDWHTHPCEGTLHGFSHPQIACHNAVLHFGINANIQHIISTHMWPLTFLHPPRSKEAIVVCIADKYCSTLETLVGFWCAAKSFVKKSFVKRGTL